MGQKTIYPSIETAYAYRKDINNDLVGKFNTSGFNQGSALSKIKYWIPKILFLQHLPNKEEVNKIDVNRMRNGFNVDVLISVDIEETVKVNGEAIEIYEGVISRENFEVSPFRNVTDKLFDIRQKYKDEFNDVMHFSVNLLMNSLYGEQIQKDIEEKIAS